MSANTRVAVALAAGLALGTFASSTEAGPWRVAADWLGPIGSIWINAIRMTVLPLVIALVITAVASTAEVKMVGRLGGRTLLVFVLLLIGAAVVMTPVAPRVFGLLPLDPAGRPPLPQGAEEAASQLAASGQAPTFAAWITTLLPTNPFAALADGAMVSVILFTVLFALAMLRIESAPRDTLLRFFRAVADTMLVIVRWVIGLAPIGVFALMYQLAATTGLKAAGAIGFYILVYGIACLVVTALLYPVVAIGAKVPIRRFAKAALPVQLIGISSSSSIATLPALIEAAEGPLGIPQRVSGFVLPLAVSVFKLAAPVAWLVGMLFVSWFYQIPLGTGSVLLVALAAVFLSFGAPGVPRGAFLLLAPLFTAVGLPVEGIGILIAVDALPDMFATVVNVTGNLAATALVASSEVQSSKSARGADAE
ncbi:MAG: dicarboxylate/amino acid:cation symporter [Gemmatimonadetes bacterium]|nr:dicarboxylate/amino acid:cation symporter [Gemmatimonadota bacterium]